MNIKSGIKKMVCTNLLTRDEFRAAVFERDKNQCVICYKDAQDAHHIIERRLWDDGGYYLDNGASLCGEHHMMAEQTVLSCDEIRQAIGIERVVLPEHLYSDNIYDKWGNIILSNGWRIKGELFYDESVQKVLGEGRVLSFFVDYVKYPRTYHLPWSEGRTDDDKVLEDTKQFEGREVVVSVKRDGENFSGYNDGYTHARSIDSGRHITRSYVKNIWSGIYYQLPKGWRVCGENMYAKHSIKYNNLKSYLLVFSIWDEKNMCLSWNDTVEYCGVLGLETVPVIYKGLWNDLTIKGLWDTIKKGYEGETEEEGYVVRVTDSFSYGNFRRSVAKFVRKDHVRTQAFWMKQKLEPNELRKQNTKDVDNEE